MNADTSRVSRTTALIAATLISSFWPNLSFAERGGALTAAETAYEQVDLEGTLEQAQRALEEGGHNRRELIRIYELIGVSSAALDQEEESREAYLRMLALAPDAQVDRNLSPQMRSPFLEARGYWVAHSERLEARANYNERNGSLGIRLSDPLEMADTVLVYCRVDDEDEFSELSEPAREVVAVELPGAERAENIEYYVVILDQYGNHVIELGNEVEPLVEGRGSEGDGEGGISRRRTLWIVLSVVGAALVTAAVATGIVVGTGSDDGGISTDVSVGVR